LRKIKLMAIGTHPHQQSRRTGLNISNKTDQDKKETDLED
jgi:hypothetical protein